MSKRGDAPGAGENASSSPATTAPTVQATPVRAGAAATPAPADAVDSGADTAVASRSQRMAALTPAATPAAASSDSADVSGADTMGADGGGAADSTDSLVGTILEQRYEILRKIGQGGMGAVYEATHKLIGKRVAVKILLDKYAQKDQIVARLEQEARLASSIGHANIIDITDIGQTAEGRMFVVMEFLDGESLGALIARSGRLEPARAIRIARQIASALGAAHKKGIVHRDIKPENVFLIRRGHEDYVKVVDFGISKSLRPEEGGGDSPRLTQTGMVLGTPLYMSPEQARGDEQLDHRIDVYAVGVILYEMVTGEVPFRGANYLNILSQVLSDEARPPRELNPEVSPDLEAVIFKALEKERDHRYQTMEDLAGDLELLDGDLMSTTGARITASRRRRRKTRQSPLRLVAWVAGLSVIVAAVVVTVVVVMGRDGNTSGAGDQNHADRAAAAAALTGALSADAGPAAARADAAPATPAVQVAHFKIVSVPTGIEVYQGGRQIGTTPFDWEWVKESKEIVLEGEKDGYDYRTMTVNPMLDDGKTIHMKLRKAKHGRGKHLNRGAGQAEGDPGSHGGRVHDNTAGGDLTPPPR